MPHGEDDEVYLFGNPPYLGAKKQNEDQKADLELVLGKYCDKYKSLDYISGWFMKGKKYIYNTKARCCFVTTNSICQGEQAALLWTPILSDHCEIFFAYHSFKWVNNAKNNAGVVVNIIGIADMRFYNKGKWLFNDNIKKKAKNINAYLTEGESILVERKPKPMFDLPEMSFGDMPNDGNSLVVELLDFLKFQDSGAGKFLKKYVGAKEFINGTYRYCIWLPYKVKNKIVEEALGIPLIRERVEMCKRHRLDSKDSSANRLVQMFLVFTMHRFGSWVC